MIFKKGIATILSTATLLTAVSPCAFAEGNNSEEKNTSSMSTTGKAILTSAGAIGLAALGGIIYYVVENSHKTPVKVETLKGTPIYGKYMELKDAVTKGEYNKVEDFLNENKELDINAAYFKGDTLLHLAVLTPYQNICELLIFRGAYIDAKNQYGETPLYTAVYNHNVEACRVLIKNDANANIRANSGETPYTQAIICNSKEICELFFDKYSVNNMFLHYAASRNSTNICKLLIDKYHVNVNTKNEYGETSLCTAFLNYATNACKLLIENGANINIRIINGNTPLHIAVQWENIALCKLLLEKGANVNAGNIFKCTPLHTSLLKFTKPESEAVKLEIVKLLIKNGADVNAKDNRGSTPLDYANNSFFKNSNDIKNLLIKNGAKRGSELK